MTRLSSRAWPARGARGSAVCRPYVYVSIHPSASRDTQAAEQVHVTQEEALTPRFEFGHRRCAETWFIPRPTTFPTAPPPLAPWVPAIPIPHLQPEMGIQSLASSIPRVDLAGEYDC
ncbi:unnamed protein product [Pleuronectes platessa]|uniref:Uncharacterized protein n=1 Tax=Pleuronectes platessa TaxID=8262 RepID=A0A9N7UH70_PLEPL|nr:unnamed protein product [Pleuronectes platessa]